ncbi:MAG: hypothetical protein HY332_04620 [Chloroflexi bacterium]|nr:hypothetical protein [Chloroflexota bacterium]
MSQSQQTVPQPQTQKYVCSSCGSTKDVPQGQAAPICCGVPMKKQG